MSKISDQNKCWSESSQTSVDKNKTDINLTAVNLTEQLSDWWVQHTQYNTVNKNSLTQSLCFLTLFIF